MDAALVTGMFNFGVNAANALSKEVAQKADVGFKDVFSKSMEKEKKVVEKKDVSKEKKNEVSDKKEKETKKDVKETTDNKDKNTEVKEKDKTEKVKDKTDKKDEKDGEDDSEELTEKMGEMLESALAEVKNNLEVQEIDLKSEETLNVEEVLSEGLVQNVVEVGPQKVETEKITSNKYDDLEEELSSLFEELKGPKSKVENKEVKTEENEGEFGEEDTNSDFVMPLEDKNVVKSKVVKSRENKQDDSTFQKKEGFERKIDNFDLKPEKIDVKISDVKLNSITDTIMSKASDIQEQIDVIKQVAEHVDVNLVEDKSEMIIKLKPDHLGKVTVEIAVENGNIVAKFLAESQKVKEILESNMQDLKDHLAKQGMVVQDLSVSVENNDKGPLFDQHNYNNFKKRQKIEGFNSEAYYMDDEYGINELQAMYYPDSTVSYSA